MNKVFTRCTKKLSMNYMQYTIQCADQEAKDILLAQLLDLGFEGFEEEQHSIKATVSAEGLDFGFADEWLQEKGYDFTWEILAEQNWNSLWESSFEPVVVDDFVRVRAHFHVPEAHVKYDLIITPKMSFGTGHHATTYLMILAMRALPIKGKRVFDFGTGTGVLAILSAKMGASAVEAIDIDSWSIENAAENIHANDVQEKIDLRQDDSPAQVRQSDIILANINKSIIMQFMPVLSQKLTPGGNLVLSGLLVDDEQDTEIVAQQAGLLREQRLELNNWLSLVYRRKDSFIK